MLDNIVTMKCLKTKEVLCIGNRLLAIDATIMEVLITKEMDNTEIALNFHLGAQLLCFGIPTSIHWLICGFIHKSTVFILFLLGSLPSLKLDLLLLLSSITLTGYRYRNIVVLLRHFLLNYITKPLPAVCQLCQSRLGIVGM